jgi:hypothetical protein
MTWLGKTLAFVNLAFSILTAGLIVVVFTTRTNWKSGYEDLQKKMDVAKAVLASERNAAAEALKRKDDEIKQAQKAVADKNTELAMANEKAKGFEAELQKANNLRDQETKNTTTNTAELERIRQERKALEDQKAKLQGDLQARTAEVVKYRDEAVSNDLKFKASQGRNERLLEQYAALKSENDRLRASGATVDSAARAAAPSAPEDVRGTVVQADGSGLATVSIGSDSGLTKNHTLHVYRLKPSPTYLGTLQILNTQPHQAVGRFQASQKRVPIQVGDEVAARVLGGSSSPYAVNGNDR